ncbi:MAG: type II toxin-antitoxin system VapC family toxin [Syntrophorhabdaceae bacterium]|nr:type II toxin-antitoxin system VapC family toxin [Syntrophorhabdaceae bacterium]
MIIIDTDVLIWVLRGQETWIERFEKMVRDAQGNVFVTAVQIAEIYAGVRPKETQKVETFLTSLRSVDLNDETGRVAGRYMNDYGKSHKVTLADAFIAATAVMKNLKLWTSNKKHYPMLDSDNFYE